MTSINDICTSTRLYVYEGVKKIYDGICKTALCEGICESINRIAEFNFKYLAVSLACAIFMHNTIIISVVIGAVFYTQVEHVAESIDFIYKKYFDIVDPIVNVKLNDWNIFYYPVHTAAIVAGIAAFYFFGPTSYLIAGVYCAARCGADIVRTSRNLTNTPSDDDLILI